ncbi:hypothetical protein RV02_GL002301 [Enterococcus gilvus]|nr:hypothetical protein RV02_GL002301 [Enterococcus gilvus]
MVYLKEKLKVIILYFKKNGMAVQSLIYYFILCSIMIFVSDFFSNFILKILVAVIITCLGEIILSTALKFYKRA